MCREKINTVSERSSFAKSRWLNGDGRILHSSKRITAPTACRPPCLLQPYVSWLEVRFVQEGFSGLIAIVRTIRVQGTDKQIEDNIAVSLIFARCRLSAHALAKKSCPHGID